MFSYTTELVSNTLNLPVVSFSGLAKLTQTIFSTADIHASPVIDIFFNYGVVVLSISSVVLTRVLHFVDSSGTIINGRTMDRVELTTYEVLVSNVILYLCHYLLFLLEIS